MSILAETNVAGAGAALAQAPTHAAPQFLFQRLLLGDDPAMWQVVAYDLALILMVFTPAIMLFAMFAIWWERKVAGHMQSRLGPNRVGPFGLLQSLADGIKLVTKEDLVPQDADALLFRMAAYLAFAPAFAAFLALPFAPNLVFEPRLNVGVFWILAILSVEVMGVILAGWASNNKWSVYGAMREACQMVSYEIPLGISIIIGVMAAGTLNMVQLGHMQSGGIHTWLIYKNPFVFLSFFCYFIASLASNKRAPFDLPESESELVAGFHTEYSGLRFAMFFFAEYAAMFVVGGIQTALFLGGWNDPFGLMGYYFAEFTRDNNTAGLVILNVVGLGIFTLKALGIVFIQMWLRWTLPRPRIDQVLYACVKVLLPLACVLLLGAALWQLLIPDRPLAVTSTTATDPSVFNPWLYYNPWNFADWVRQGYTGQIITQVILALIGVTLLSLTTGWIVYAAASGRNLKQRLTDPAPLMRVPDNLVKA